IIGLETYLAPESRHSRNPGDKSPYHLLLLARNMEGYRNLLQLSSKAHLEGFYYKPRVDRDLLKEYSGGLIALSGCPTAEVPRLLLEGRSKDAKEAALWYRDTFGEFFLELQRHENIPDLQRLNEALLEMNRETGLPLVATNDCHYIRQEDAPFQDILICIHTNTNIHDDKRLKMSDDSYYLKTAAEMENLFADLPEAIATTQRIADMCDLELDFSQMRLPEYKTPDGLNAGEYLAQLCREGMSRRYSSPSPEVHQRLAYELDVIGKTQFDNYLLVVWDIATFTRENDILFGVRGSAAASLVLYCLGVTDIDPLQYRLVFERFLNLERREMPDIDMDFQDDRREEVIAYVRRKYGGDHVAQIITFGTLGAKAALRDTGRALGMTYSDVDRVARLIPFRVNSLAEALEVSVELKDIYEADDTLKNLVDTAQHLEGVVRHASTHAAGVVITKEPLVEYLPLQRPIRGDTAEDMAMTQFPMDPIAKLGLLKMDFLGLTNLTILEQARRTVDQRRGVHMSFSQIPLDDEKTFKLLSDGQTTGVFQLEGAGMRRYIQKLKPNTLGDVAAMIALYRPGPMEHIDTFIEAKHDNALIRYPHPALKDILEETYGVIVYQDQVLLIAQAFAGYSLGEADVVRKAMGKKIPEVMRLEREKFLEGALLQGFSQDLAEEVFQLIEPFAGYAFNKAHSVSYAMIAYWTAFFKANYPEEYLAALMNAHTGQGDKIASDVTECLRLGIPVLLPDVNRSKADFSIDVSSEGKTAIRFGLAAVKNVGSMAVVSLVEELKDGPYRSVEDLCRRADIGSINRRAMESLIKVGALDSLGDRGSLLASVERIISLAQREAHLKGSGQTTMFDLFGDAVSTSINSIELEEGEMLNQEKLAWEKELLGTFISENPLSALAHKVPPNVIISRDGIDPEMEGRRINVVGQVSSQRTGITRDGKPFAAVILDLLGGSVDVMVWSNAYNSTKDLWYEGSLVEVVGKVRLREDDLSIACDEAKPYNIEGSNGHAPQEAEHTSTLELPAHTGNGTSNSSDGSNGNNRTSATPSHAKLWIRVEESSSPGHDEHMLRELVKLLLNYPGDGSVALRIMTDGKMVVGEMPSVSIRYCTELHQELVTIVGEEAIEVVSRVQG
ncbi:DNA polymerase III subunit alpha, partial [SAR202 cluster bacterium AC-647-N09_OGT_505m]|nr:DNA polymerase III subunit alpha [SAR202 cluster bacterium AC-647-N09_OGT_505m]